MDNLNLPPFYKGQKVLANQNHDNGVTKGEKYTVLGIKRSHCGWVVNVGVSMPLDLSHGHVRCFVCGAIFPTNVDGYWWCNAIIFSTLKESTFPSLTWSKVLEKESELISMN